ncbi:uncharacterized protein LOC144798833 [Lissotriton helveticus]
MPPTNSKPLAFPSGNSDEFWEQRYLELNYFCEVDEKVVSAACEECHQHRRVPIEEAAKRYLDKLRLHQCRLMEKMDHISKQLESEKRSVDFEIQGADDWRRIVRKNSKEKEILKQSILLKLSEEYNHLKTKVAEIDEMITKSPVQLLKDVKRVQKMLEEVKIKAPEGKY